MICNFDFYSEIGGREDNQDKALATKLQNGYLFVVADGLGGHNGGAVASGIVIKTLEEYMKSTTIQVDSLEFVIKAANLEIIKNQVAYFSDMKTTIAAVCIDNDFIYISNVGDSRIYAFKNGELVFQSMDHSATQMAVLLGEITKDEMRTHADRNRLTRALGGSEQLTVEKQVFKKDDFDALLLCSDGFWEDVLEEDMCLFLKGAKSPEEWLNRMKRYICHTENHDNHTAIAVFLANDEKIW